MGSSMERHPPGFDPSQPGVRQLQHWIRHGTSLGIELLSGGTLTGLPRWVDADFLALQTDASSEPVLLSRRAIAVIRALI